ncbi:DUF3506 domain-containing protein, partial [Haematococcus lacustris]
GGVGGVRLLGSDDDGSRRCSRQAFIAAWTCPSVTWAKRATQLGELTSRSARVRPFGTLGFGGSCRLRAAGSRLSPRALGDRAPSSTAAGEALVDLELDADGAEPQGLLKASQPLVAPVEDEQGASEWEDWLQLFAASDAAAERAEELKQQLSDAVTMEAYTTAAGIKQELQELEANNVAATVQKQLEAALAVEDYEAAAKCCSEGLTALQGWWAGTGEGDAVGHLLHVAPEYGRYTGRAYTARDLAELAGWRDGASPMQRLRISRPPTSGNSSAGGGGTFSAPTPASVNRPPRPAGSPASPSSRLPSITPGSSVRKSGPLGSPAMEVFLARGNLAKQASARRSSSSATRARPAAGKSAGATSETRPGVERGEGQGIRTAASQGARLSSLLGLGPMARLTISILRDDEAAATLRALAGDDSAPSEHAPSPSLEDQVQQQGKASQLAQAQAHHSGDEEDQEVAEAELQGLQKSSRVDEGGNEEEVGQEWAAAAAELVSSLEGQLASGVSITSAELASLASIVQGLSAAGSDNVAVQFEVLIPVSQLGQGERTAAAVARVAERVAAAQAQQVGHAVPQAGLRQALASLSLALAAGESQDLLIPSAARLALSDDAQLTSPSTSPQPSSSPASDLEQQQPQGSAPLPTDPASLSQPSSNPSSATPKSASSSSSSTATATRKAASSAAAVADAELAASGSSLVRYSRVALGDRNSRTDPFSGLFLGSFGPHGPELLQLQVGRKHKLSARDVYPEELGAIARYKGEGKVAQKGYSQPAWVDGELLVFGPGGSQLTGGAELGFVWIVPGERRYLILLSKLDLSSTAFSQ